LKDPRPKFQDPNSKGERLKAIRLKAEGKEPRAKFQEPKGGDFYIPRGVVELVKG